MHLMFFPRTRPGSASGAARYCANTCTSLHNCWHRTWTGGWSIARIAPRARRRLRGSLRESPYPNVRGHTQRRWTEARANSTRREIPLLPDRGHRLRRLVSDAVAFQGLEGILHLLPRRQLEGIEAATRHHEEQILLHAGAHST